MTYAGVLGVRLSRTPRKPSFPLTKEPGGPLHRRRTPRLRPTPPRCPHRLGGAQRRCGDRPRSGARAVGAGAPRTVDVLGNPASRPRRGAGAGARRSAREAGAGVAAVGPGHDASEERGEADRVDMVVAPQDAFAAGVSDLAYECPRGR